MKKRVVVTGLGAVTPLGLNVGDTWKNICEGRSGIGKITLFDIGDCASQIAGEVKNFVPTATLPKPFKPFGPTTPADSIVSQICHPKEVKKMGRFIQLSLGASMEAYGLSGLDNMRDRLSADRIGTNIGVGMGGLPEIEETHNDFLAKGYRRISPFFIPSVIANMAGGQLSILLNCRGPNLCNVTACTSSAHALGEAFRIIQRGEADVMIAGGAEAVIYPLAVGGFASMRALSTRNSEPERASRPFDTGRDGFVIAEGAATLILEEYEHAKARGAKIFAEFLGYGLSADAHHMTLPAPEGEGGFRAMKLALAESGLRPDQVGYVNAHGTSTPAGDLEESRAIARLFPEGRNHLHVSSTKSMTGHMLGAAGAVEALFCILSLQDGIIPPTMNLENLDPECEKLGLNFTPLKAVRKQYRAALSNSFGFGGTNASLLFGAVS